MTLLDELRRVLLIAAPDADPDELDRQAKAMAAHAAIHRAGRLAALRRGRKPGLEALDGLYHGIDGVIDLIDKLQPDAQIALRRRPGAPSLADMTRVLWEWNEYVSAARAQLGLSPDEPTRRGRDGKGEAERIAAYCATTFADLTGETATVRTRDNRAYGPFIELVRGVFSALGIEASAETMAKRATSREKTRPPAAD